MRRVRQPKAEVLNGAHEDRWIVPGTDEAPTLPIAFGFSIDRPDDSGTAADDLGSSDTAAQRILDQSAADTLSGVMLIDRKLSNEEARNGVRRTPGADRTRRAVWLDHAWCDPVIADNGAVVVNDENTGEAARLIGPRKAGQPRIEGRLAAVKCLEPVRVIEEFDP